MFTDTPTSTGPEEVRASNAERERVAEILRAAAEQGMLSLEEVDMRLATAYGVTYRSELDPLVADLPERGRRLVPPSAAEQEQVAAFRSAFRSGMFRHATGIVVVAGALVTLWAAFGAGFFWPAFPLAFLIIGLVRHAMFRSWRARRWANAHAHAHAHESGSFGGQAYAGRGFGEHHYGEHHFGRPPWAPRGRRGC